MIPSPTTSLDRTPSAGFLRGPSRRRFLRLVGGVAAVGSLAALAGCGAPAAPAPTATVAAPAVAPTSPPPTTAPTTAPPSPTAVPPTATTAAATTPTAAPAAPPATAAAPTPTSAAATATTPTVAAATATTSTSTTPNGTPVAGKPMYQVDAQHTGRSPYAGPTSAVLLRSFDLTHPPYDTPHPGTPREDIQSSSAIGPDGTIYLSDFPGNLVALRDPGQGSSLELVWRFHPDGASPLHATPAVGSDGSVYEGFSAGTGTAAQTTFFAVKAPASGKEAQAAWSVSLGAGRMTSSPTLGPDGTIYAYSGPGKLFAISPSGQIQWTAPAGPSLRSAPALGPDGTVYLPSTDGKLYAVAPPSAGGNAGTVRWTFDFGQHLGSTPLVTSSRGGGGSGIGSGASPTIGPDGTIYIGANNSNFYALTPSGEMKWLFEAERELAGIWATAALSADAKTLYFGANKGGIYALNSADGKLVWQFPIYGSVYSSPALDSAGRLYTGSTIGHIFGLDTSNGHALFDYNANAQVWSAPSILPNGTLLVADRKGKVLLLGNG